MEMTNKDLDWARSKLLAIVFEPEFLTVLIALEEAQRMAQEDWRRRQRGAQWRGQGEPPVPPPGPSL